MASIIRFNFRSVRQRASSRRSTRRVNDAAGGGASARSNPTHPPNVDGLFLCRSILIHHLLHRRTHIVNVKASRTKCPGSFFISLEGCADFHIGWDLLEVSATGMFYNGSQTRKTSTVTA